MIEFENRVTVNCNKFIELLFRFEEIPNDMNIHSYNYLTKFSKIINTYLNIIMNFHKNVQSY